MWLSYLAKELMSIPNLATRRQVAVTIDPGHSPADAQALLIRGTATLETVDGIPEEYIVAAAKTMTPDGAAEFEVAVQAMYTQMVRISIEPGWARFYDFGAGRMPRFLHDLAGNAARLAVTIVSAPVPAPSRSAHEVRKRLRDVGLTDQGAGPRGPAP